MNDAVLRHADDGDALAARAVDTALWLFIGVAGILFALLLTAYAMRMDGGDWSPIAVPRQLWLSSALLLAASLLLQAANAAIPPGRQAQALALLRAGGACGLAFLFSQCWAWQVLQAARVSAAGNPAASFFYLLTAVHALHVLGGLAVWTAAQAAMQRGDALHATSRAALCARYWHFLLGAWMALFAALAWLTPDFVRFVCGRG